METRASDHAGADSAGDRIRFREHLTPPVLHPGWCVLRQDLLDAGFRRGQGRPGLPLRDELAVRQQLRELLGDRVGVRLVVAPLRPFAILTVIALLGQRPCLKANILRRPTVAAKKYR